MSGKVMIVDDDITIVRGMTMLLETEGIAACGTSSPFEVPLMLKREQPDVVLLDLQMPALGGQAMLELAREKSMIGHARVLLFSGRSSSELSELTESVGADGYVCKSEDAGQIVRRIHFWIRQSRRGNAA
ncbi:MAG TPA: response regulator [Thermoanaerobaculia bacterium]|nr:response regulator [Thermoanaerobaculia bacterium]